MIMVVVVVSGGVLTQTVSTVEVEVLKKTHDSTNEKKQTEGKKLSDKNKRKIAIILVSCNAR